MSEAQKGYSWILKRAFHRIEGLKRSLSDARTMLGLAKKTHPERCRLFYADSRHQDVEFEIFRTTDRLNNVAYEVFIHPDEGKESMAILITDQKLLGPYQRMLEDLYYRLTTIYRNPHKPIVCK